MILNIIYLFYNIIQLFLDFICVCLLCGNMAFLIFRLLIASISLLLYTIYLLWFFVMPCYQDCGKHIYTSILGQSPCYPACQLAHILDLIEMHPCLVCRTPIFADLPYFHYPGCVQAS
jgi:hypothetical protein